MESTQKSILGMLLTCVLLAGCTPRAAPAQPLASPPPPTDTATAVFTPSPQPTPTPALMTGGEIPCYAGPGPEYGIAATLRIAVRAEVLGRDAGGEYWIIRMPGADRCWIGTRYATILGEPETIPTMLVESLPTAEVERITGPSILAARTSCAYDQAKQNQKVPQDFRILVRLLWPDVRGERGYRLYLEGDFLAEVQAGTDQYDHWFTATDNLPARYTYAVEAFDENGASTQTQVEVKVRGVCPGF